MKPPPIPSEFFGWYTQAAYRLWDNGKRSLAPFVRYERYNVASSYAALPTGVAQADTPAGTESVATVGLNYKLNPNVVLKADYQSFHVDSSRNRFDLGLGFTY